ncbi:hypothetical protein UFOVP760_160 [uncultured Caudovirales phage]|uniref:Uncharacterized protein n=1 Tax=uncultured Caudovirales phage TaxID=2100421 RepID=A0A6J7X9S1_9CAUD|nr:hypothetical protein UFOVP760_160 [uncultured Caudovirales phage]
MKKKVLFEDTVSYYNKWVAGQASREFSAQRTKFKDLFGSIPDQSPNNSKADDLLAYPLPNVVPVLGDLMTNHSNCVNMFKTALNNPNIKEDGKAVAEIKSVISCLNNSLTELKKIFTVLKDGID